MTKEGIPLLVFTSEIITLGDPLSADIPIEVEVLEVRGDKVRIGVKAPRSVEVHRKEIWLQIQQERLMGGGGECCMTRLTVYGLAKRGRM